MKGQFFSIYIRAEQPNDDDDDDDDERASELNGRKRKRTIGRRLR